MFTKSHLPESMPKGTPKAVLEALEAYRSAADLYERANNVEGIGDRDLDRARDDDRALMLEALKKGEAPESVGKPNEAAVAQRREAYRTASQLAAREAAQTDIRVKQTLDEHADALVDLFSTEAATAQAAYREAIDNVIAARQVLERAAVRLKWAASIDGKRVPNVIESAAVKMMLPLDFTAHPATGSLEVALTADADRLAAYGLPDRTQRLDAEARERRFLERQRQIAADRAAANAAKGAPSEELISGTPRDATRTLERLSGR